MIIEGIGTGNMGEVTSKKSQLVSLQQRGNAFSVSSLTGTMAAALGANGCIFAMRFDAGSGTKRAYIERVQIQYVTIVAYTTPLTAGRRLSIYRGSGANASSGTAITTVAKKHSPSAESEFETAQGGDMRISATAGLTVTGITFETNEFAILPLIHVGNAGNYIDNVFDFNACNNAPLVLEPGQLLAIRNPQAMDAAGTWQAVVKVDWYEEDTTTL